ncbi:uncharacterized protein LOC113673933 [Pocillopora damicornis]|uniref:uncharacterized protein LOC113673933 n=1 Tax=Pocillopora damicornis TaxID=46731 RepID=UPI000F551176|nr:uncharacterized protein LOC113673933 [Pocillopora damicornis]
MYFPKIFHLITLHLLVVSLASQEEQHTRRSYTVNPGKILFCPSARAGPPGPPGPPGLPGRDGRDGRDCPPCNCASVPSPPVESPCPGSPPPVPQGPPVGGPPEGLGSAHNPAKSCDEIYHSISAGVQSGVYWLQAARGSPYQAHCEIITSACKDNGGWTLVARVAGMSGDFSPTSPLWANEDVVSPWDAADITKTTSMKNPGWFSVPNRVIRMCYSGPRSDCATFTHNRGLTLTQLFATQFAVEVQEEYTFETLMKKLGKHLDLGHLKTEWCGLNLGNLCNLVADPNKEPGTHVCRIGCIGDTSLPRSPNGCNPDDYSLGIGVSSCNSPHGCHGHVSTTSSLHFSMYSRYGDYQQTAFIYVK